MSKPIIFETEETISEEFLGQLEKEISDSGSSKTLLDFPVVYIHSWNNDSQIKDIYVGESIDIIQRTRSHFENSEDPKSWQHEMLDKKVKLYILGYEHFNKSFTLDVENKLIQYFMTMDNVRYHNLRTNPQDKYYPCNEFEEVFSSFWRQLRKSNKDLFLSETEIRDSAIFKASPLHKLTIEQMNAKESIINKVHNTLGKYYRKECEKGQLIFVEGEAGTGKTVLASSTFYDIINEWENTKNSKMKCRLLVNHDEQITVYEQIVRKLNLEKNDYKEIVKKPTTFINNTSENDPVDVVFVDEAHLLLTRGKQSYRGKNQLEDIRKRAIVTIIMFDQNQVLGAEQYWEKNIIDSIRNEAKSNNNYIELKTQMRVVADENTIKWLDDFTKEGKISKLGKDTKGYEIKMFDSPEKLYEDIKKKSQCPESHLSRLIATYDWEYKNDRKPEGRDFWNVKIGDFDMPWNRELLKGLSSKEKSRIKNISWAEQPHTIDEVGSTYTIQGFDLNYAGVIIGPSVSYKDDKVIFIPDNSFANKAKGGKTMSDGTVKHFGEELLKHELRVLLTRGVNGLYIYACDEKLREKLKEAISS